MFAYKSLQLNYILIICLPKPRELITDAPLPLISSQFVVFDFFDFKVIPMVISGFQFPNDISLRRDLETIELLIFCDFSAPSFHSIATIKVTIALSNKIQNLTFLIERKDPGCSHTLVTHGCFG